MRDLSNLSHPNPLAFWAAAYQRHCPPMLSFIHKKHTRDVHDMTEKESVHFSVRRMTKISPSDAALPSKIMRSKAKESRDTKLE